VSVSTPPSFRTEPFHISAVLGKSVKIYLDLFVVFVVIALIFLLPGAVTQFAFGAWPAPVSPKPGAAPDLTGVWASLLINVLLQIVGGSTLILLSFQKLNGEAGDVGAAFRRALSRFFPVLGIFLLVWLFIVIGIAVGIVVGMAFYLARSHFTPTVSAEAFSMIGFALAFVLASVLLIILACMFSVATQASLAESLGPWASMQRSRKLSKGERWRIFGLLLIAFLPMFVLVFASTSNGAGIVSPTALSLGGLVVNLLWMPFSAAFSAVLFHDLRLAKESADKRVTEQLLAS